MREVTNKEIDKIVENIVTKVNKTTNDYDAAEDIKHLLVNMLKGMKIPIEEEKNNTECKCKNCGCEKE